MFNSNLWPNSSAPAQNIRHRNLSDLECDLSRALKVKCDSVIGLPIYAFLSVFNINIWPNSAPLQDIRLQNLSELEFYLSRSLKVKCDSVSGFRDTGRFSKLPYLGMKLDHWPKCQKLHIYLLSTPKGAKLSLFSIYGQLFSRYRPIEKLP